MTQEIIDDCLFATKSITNDLYKLAQIAILKQNFKSGKPLTLSVSCEELELSERLLLSNGKALFVDDIFNTFELQTKLAVKGHLCSLQTFFEQGENE